MWCRYCGTQLARKYRVLVLESGVYLEIELSVVLAGQNVDYL